MSSVNPQSPLQDLAPQTDVFVIGAGLAGSEAALTLAETFGLRVTLVEMRPQKMTEAHKTGEPAELVCSNSFGSKLEGSAPWALKREAQELGSFILQAAKESAVPAGAALAVDREELSRRIKNRIIQSLRIRLHSYAVQNLTELPQNKPCIIATGPLTAEPLAHSLREHFGADFCYFFDAIAPIISADSIDWSQAFFASRYGKGGDDYANIPLTQEQYESLIDQILRAEKVTPKDFEKVPYFEGCMPIEAMAERGRETLRFGPMKPVGLEAPGWKKPPYAVIQLRAENRERTAFNMVGFQTRMKYGEQIRVFRQIPGLEQAEFLKLGSMHKNLFIHTPSQLTPYLQDKKNPHWFFAGQMTGVEGYFESACIGWLVAYFVSCWQRGTTPVLPPRESALGSLLWAITTPERAEHFQPTNINFGLLPRAWEQIPTERRPKKFSKELHRQYQLQRAYESFKVWRDQILSHEKVTKMAQPQEQGMPI